MSATTTTAPTGSIPTAPPPKTGAMKVYAFPLGADGLVNGRKKTLVDFGAENGCDGMCVDIKGNIYLTCRSLKRPGLMVIDPTGQGAGLRAHRARRIRTAGKEPVGLPSNCEFGIGGEDTMLYLTVDKSLYRIRLKVAGYHVPFKKVANGPQAAPFIDQLPIAKENSPCTNTCCGPQRSIWTTPGSWWPIFPTTRWPRSRSRA